MKPLPLTTVTLGLALAGCSEKSEKTPQTTNAGAGSGSLVTAPVDYLKTITKAEQSAVKTVDVTSLNKAIEMFNVQEGRFPKDLNELVEKKYFPKIPEAPYGMKIVYDASIGTVSIVKE